MRFPQAILIDPRKVLPSRHSIFIRGFPGNVSIDDIKELFSKHCDGNCKIDFFSYSEDKSQLFLAIRFDSHSVAKRLISKYDGERIFGYKVELNWFKDIRKARKKALRRMGLKRFGGKFMQRHYEAPPIRQCVSSSNSSGSRSRSSSFSRQSRSPHRRGSSSSDSSRSPPRPLPVRRRSPVKSSHSDSGSCSSSSSSSSGSCRSAVNGRKEQPIPPATQLVYEYDELSGEKEVLEAALKACSPPDRKNVSASHSDSAGSRQSSTHTSRRSTRGDEEHDHQVEQQLRKEPQKEQQQPENVAVPYVESSDDEQSPKRKREKRKKHSRHRKNKRSKRVRSLGTPLCLDSADVEDVPANASNAVDPENVPADVASPVKKSMDDEEIHEILEVEQLSLNNIFLPDEAPEPTTEEKLDASDPLPTSPPATNPDETDVAEPTVEEPVTQAENENNVEQTDTGTQTTFEPGLSKSTSTDFGMQAFVLTKGSSALSGTDEILSQLSALTDSRIDEIFQQKRLIEAAYRLDCEGYTASVGKLVRLNPDLKDRLLASLRTLLEDRARQSINELQEFILKTRN